MQNSIVKEKRTSILLHRQASNTAALSFIIYIDDCDIFKITSESERSKEVCDWTMESGHIAL